MKERLLEMCPARPKLTCFTRQICADKERRWGEPISGNEKRREGVFCACKRGREPVKNGSHSYSVMCDRRLFPDNAGCAWISEYNFLDVVFLILRMDIV